MIKAMIEIYFLIFFFTFKCREQRKWPPTARPQEKYIPSEIKKSKDEIKYMYII